MSGPVSCAFCGKADLPAYSELLGSDTCLGCLGEYTALAVYGVEGEARAEYERRREARRPEQLPKSVRG